MQLSRLVRDHTEHLVLHFTSYTLASKPLISTTPSHPSVSQLLLKTQAQNRRLALQSESALSPAPIITEHVAQVNENHDITFYNARGLQQRTAA